MVARPYSPDEEDLDVPAADQGEELGWCQVGSWRGPGYQDDRGREVMPPFPREHFEAAVEERLEGHYDPPAVSEQLVR